MKSLTTENHLRHVESMATLPSGAGKIPHLNAVILGEALASEENDLVYPSEEFSLQAHVPNPAKVNIVLFLDFYQLRSYHFAEIYRKMVPSMSGSFLGNHSRTCQLLDFGV